MHSTRFFDQAHSLARDDVDYILIHRMRPDQWDRIGPDGRLHN